MATHLSARLAWHDRGWDGTICAAPHLNTSCVALRHIRKGRNDARERQAATAPIATLPGWQPPCAQDAFAYAPRGYLMTYRDPLESRGLAPAREEAPPYSCSPVPYRWLREESVRDIAEAEGLSLRPPERPSEGGWVNEPDRQSHLLRSFWQKIEPTKSLIFYYCNHGNPVSEDAPRVIVGVGRIADLGPQLYFGMQAGQQEHAPVWARRVTQSYPFEGVRIPYQEYLARNLPVDGIFCPVPQSALASFSFAAEHVSDDTAVAALERIIQSIERVRADGLVVGDWDGRLAWLNDALAGVWNERGPCPGAGSVLQYLGFAQGTIYQRETLAPLAQRGSNPWEYILAAFAQGEPGAPEWVRLGLACASERWRDLPEPRRALLTELARYELSEEQVRRIADPDQRQRAGLARNGAAFSDDDIRANPYLIAESYVEATEAGTIPLETIDHGMRPEGAAAFPRAGEAVVSHDDQRRARAVVRDVLEAAASDGDTLLPFADLLERVRTRFPARRACLPDRDMMRAGEAFYREILWLALDQQPALAALNRLRRSESTIARLIEQLASKAYEAVGAPVPWRAALEALFGAPETARERAALDEKVVALGRLFERRISVLMGGAGTGKTTVLRAFLAELERLEGAQPLLLLAPTGKARVRLARQTGRPSGTIHQFLLGQEWLSSETFTLRESSAKDAFRAVTVVIDECSMVSVDLLGALLRALDMNTVRRLILVGDPNQLPPVGPGRPFTDIIAWLSERRPDCISSLQVGMRTDAIEGRPEEASVALTLANGYRAERADPGDDE
ncbi:MAG TPA: AAA family ATPase, partial [Ktedonobacterales bacterium]